MFNLGWKARLQTVLYLDKMYVLFSVEIIFNSIYESWCEFVF